MSDKADIKQTEVYNKPKFDTMSIREGNKPFDALDAYIELSRSIQEDFQRRGITKEDLNEAIRWVRKRRGRRR